MAIRGITFSKQTVTSNDDAHIYELLLNGRKGKTKGCKMTFGTDDIYISDGYFFVANRLIQISSMETVTTPIVTTGTVYCRLVFEVDFAKTNTNTDFNQGEFKILQSSTTEYPEITQEDIENGGNIYQIPFAKFTKSISGIATFSSELETIGYLNESKTIYVSTSGDDASGDGSQTFPYKTIQHAIDSIPKCLAGHEVKIAVGFGVYPERLLVKNFNSGKIVIGAPGDVFSIYGIDIVSSSFVETNIHQIDRNPESSLPLYCVKNGSIVVIDSEMILDGIDQGATGILAENNSNLAVRVNTNINVSNCAAAVSANTNSNVSIETIDGTDCMFGMIALRGSIVSYKTDNLSKYWSNSAESGGLVLTGSNSTTLSGATLDL